MAPILSAGVNDVSPVSVSGVKLLPDVDESGVEVRVQHIPTTLLHTIGVCEDRLPHLLTDLHKLSQGVYPPLKLLVQRNTLLQGKVIVSIM